MRYHHQNLTDGRLPLWRHGRAWWGRLHWGWNLCYRTELTLLGVNWWGFVLYLRWFGLHASWARDDDDDRGRWEVSWHDGCLWLEHPWVRQDGWSRADPWWRKQCVLHVVDWLIGRVRYETVKETPTDCFVPMPEGCYRATATRRTLTWHRRWYWPRKVWVSYDIDIPGGIPFAGKGENSWDCGDDGLFGIGGGPDCKTLEGAIGAVVASVLKSRAKYGHDSLRTGAQPARIIERAAQ